MQPLLFTNQVISILENIGIYASIKLTATGDTLMHQASLNRIIKLELEDMLHMASIPCHDGMVYVFKLVGFDNLLISTTEVMF